MKLAKFESAPRYSLNVMFVIALGAGTMLTTRSYLDSFMKCLDEDVDVGRGGGKVRLPLVVSQEQDAC